MQEQADDKKRVIRIAAGAIRDGRRIGPAVPPPPTRSATPPPRVAPAPRGEGARRVQVRARGQTARTGPVDARQKLTRALPAGRVVANRYQVQQLLDEGGMGIVYRGFDTVLEMPVALKFLLPAVEENPATLQDLKREARITISLAHPNIVRLYNLERFEQGYFLVMEYVEGETLRTVLHRLGRLDPHTVSMLVTAGADALAYAHRNGITHNDLKPDNMILSRAGVLKIIDFGTACLAGLDTTRDLITGTPAYMSPEQKRGEKSDHRADIYALAIVAYELLTGLVPFPLQLSTEELLHATARMSGVDARKAAVLERATAEDPADRWASVAEFAAAFRTAIES